MRTFFSSIILFLVLALPGAVFAVTVNNLSGDMSADLSPANPGPNTVTTIALSSLSTDLRAATITWQLDGKEFLKGPGKNVATITTRGAGQTSIVHVIADTLEGDEMTQDITITPADITILWNARTYTPPLFRGKALPTEESVITLTAYPEFQTSDGVALNQADLIYTWKKDGHIETTQSGRGKSTVSYQLGILPGDTEFSVEAQSPDGVLRISKTVSVPMISPRAMVYEEHPLEGTRYNTPLFNQFQLVGSEMTLRIEPFFFSLPLARMAFGWAMNTDKPTIGTQLLALRHDKNVSGTTDVTGYAGQVDISGQRAQHTLTINFGTP